MGVIFDTLYGAAPFRLKALIGSTKRIQQNPIWHPEIFVFNHINYVTTRLFLKYNDINLTLAGLFHDLGKIDTTKWDEDRKTWTAHDHETYSVKYVDQYSWWINNRGGDVDIIKYIVKNHMRIKYFDSMKRGKKIQLFEHPYFDLLLKFNSADYGGDGLDCKEIIYPVIKNYKKRTKRNYLEKFLNRFYIKGRIFFPKGKYFLLKTKKPFIIEVNAKISQSKRKKVCL